MRLWPKAAKPAGIAALSSETLRKHDRHHGAGSADRGCCEGPVLASGGIMDGRGIAAALALGACGVQLGTAFLTCREAGVSPGIQGRHPLCPRGPDAADAGILRPPGPRDRQPLPDCRRTARCGHLAFSAAKRVDATAAEGGRRTGKGRISVALGGPGLGIGPLPRCGRPGGQTRGGDGGGNRTTTGIDAKLEQHPSMARVCASRRN